MEHEDLMSAPSMVESQRAIEAILMVASDPTPTHLLAQIIELPIDEVDQLCRELALGYDMANHGFQLVEVAGGWRYQTHPDLHPYVERFAMDGQSSRLSTAALETLSIVAYKQPISRAQVSAIRGVNVDAVLRTLVQRGYVEEVGRDVGAGQAILFGTTSYFLERIGLNETADLPALGDFVPSAEVVEALEQTLRVEVEVDPELTIEDEAPPAIEVEAAPGPVEVAVEGEVEHPDGEHVIGADSEVVAEPEVDDDLVEASTRAQPSSLAESGGIVVARVDLASDDDPVAEPEPVVEPEPVAEAEPEPRVEVEAEPEPAAEPEPEPGVEGGRGPKPATDPVGDH